MLDLPAPKEKPRTLSLKDRLFFPLAVLLAIGMVFIALSAGFGRLPTGAVTGDGVNYDRITIEGEYLHKVYAGGDATTQLVKDPDGTYGLFISAQDQTLNDAAEFGPHFRLAQDLEVQFSGRRIRCTVTVKPAADRGATQVALNYSAGRIGESGWQILDLAPGTKEVSFEYDLPTIEGDQGVDYFGIRPVAPEKPRAIIVEKVVFERLPPMAETPPSE